MKKALQVVIVLAAGFGFVTGLMIIGADAAERQMNWDHARMCKTYGKEINAYAARHGGEPSCK